MGLSSPRPRGGASVGGLLAAGVAGEKQVRRMVSRIPPSTPAGGGPVGYAELYSETGSISTDTSGMDPSSPTYAAPYDPFDFGGSLDWISTTGSEVNLDVGSYYAPVEFNFLWSAANAADAADYYKPVVRLQGPGSDFDKQIIAATTDESGSRGLHHFHPTGPFYISGLDALPQAQLRFIGATSAALYFPRLVWRITKLA